MSAAVFCVPILDLTKLIFEECILATINDRIHTERPFGAAIDTRQKAEGDQNTQEKDLRTSREIGKLFYSQNRTWFFCLGTLPIQATQQKPTVTTTVAILHRHARPAIMMSHLRQDIRPGHRQEPIHLLRYTRQPTQAHVATMIITQSHAIVILHDKRKLINSIYLYQMKLIILD